MASTIKVDKIEGSTGSTITVPTGQTLTLTDGLAVASLPVVTVAKGGTNLTSFTAGDVLYATGATTLTKLAKGSAADVLTMNSGATAPEWAAAAGGAWTKIKTVTVSGSTASVSFINGTSDVVIDDTYSTYKVIMNGIAGHDATGWKMYVRIYDGGTDGTGTTLINSGTDYRYASTYGDSNGSHLIAYSNGASFMHLGTVQLVDNSTGEGFSGEFTAMNTEQVAADNCYKLFTWIGTTKENYVHGYHGGGVWIQQKTVRGFQFYPHASSFTKGEFVLYGIK